jgi:hypothetical protein
MEVQPWMGLGDTRWADQHHVLTGHERAERSANGFVTLDQVQTEIRFELRKGLECRLDGYEVERL